MVTTVNDEAAMVDRLFEGKLLRASSRVAMLDTALPAWFLYLPHEKTTVVVFSNIYSSAATTIGYDVAAIVRGLPHEAFHASHPPPSTAELATSSGTFQFGQ